ncbi:MAG: glycosyltransferase family 39 protein [Dehalococcoidia bacterium]
MNQQHEVEEPPGPALKWRSLVPGLPLLAALLASVVAYWPALRSPFYADDYLYLSASRNLTFGEYAKASLVPYSDQPLLESVTRYFWRPLYYLSFGLLEPILGEHATGYHLLLLAIHLASVFLVWLLVRQLSGSRAAAGVAAVVFAAHPAAFEGVAWISSLSNIGLPLMLAAWLLFARAIHKGELKWPLVIGSAALVAAALGFRESTVAVVPAMGLWWLATRRASALKDWRSYRVFVPCAVLGLGYLLLRTRFLTEPATNHEVWRIDGDAAGEFWYYAKQLAFPAGDSPGGMAHVVQVVAATVLLAATPLLWLLRRPVAAALVAGTVISVLPYAPLQLGDSPRYLYFPAASLAIAVGFLLDEAFKALQPRFNERTVFSGTAALGAVLLVLGTVVIHQRTTDWVNDGPEVEQAWVDELRAAAPSLQPGATLYCANPPIILALFENALLQPTVSFYYPGVAVKRFEATDLAKVEASLGPNDRIFIPSGTPRK